MDSSTLAHHPRPRARRVTIVDVAREAGVSVASASKVVRETSGVSEEMRRRVQAAVRQLSYRPHRLAQGLRGSTKTVGVLLPDIENAFFGLLLDGAIEVFAESGHELFLALAGSTRLSHEAVTDSLIDYRMDGLLLVSPHASTEHLERVGREVPVVAIGRHGPAESYDTVASDDETGSRLIVEHLVEAGHRRIVFLANETDDDPSLPETVRADGFRVAMERAGLPADFIRTPWTFEGGRAAARELLARDVRPTAVHAGADIVALGLMSELWDRGLEIPRDVSVVGYDDSPTARLRPVSLTSVDQSGREIGRIAARLLLERLAGRTDSRHELFAPRLSVRTTTAPLGSTD